MRLSPEKSPHVYVELIEHLSDHLAAAGIVPLLAGAQGDAQYAAEIKVRRWQCLFIRAGSNFCNWQHTLYDHHSNRLVDTQARLRACSPDAVIIEDFLSPRDMARLLLQTRLNMHPCEYDAYGMTVVEGMRAGGVAAGVVYRPLMERDTVQRRHAARLRCFGPGAWLGRQSFWPRPQGSHSSTTLGATQWTRRRTMCCSC